MLLLLYHIYARDPGRRPCDANRRHAYANLCVAHAALYNQTEQSQKALEVVLSRRFHPWEGGEGQVSDQYVAACIALGQSALESGRAQEGLEHFEAARNFPENLGEAPHPLTPNTRIDYLAGLAREALGDSAAAKSCFQRAAGDQRGLSAMTYYQALAMKRLGDEEAGRQRLQELLDFATRQLESAGKTSFATSVPRFVFEEDDPQKRRQIAHTYLLGLALLGLDETAGAEDAFKKVLALDPHHQGAREELRQLAF